jgi:hypothetical protein
MASKAQQSCVGTASTKPRGGGFATVGSPPRMTGPGATPAGCIVPSRTVAFIGEVVTRAVSLRKPAWAAPGFPARLLIGGNTGFGGAGGSGAFNPAGGSDSGGRAAGGRTGVNGGGSKSAAGASASTERTGGRFGKMMRVDSFSTGRVGVGVLCGGRLMRTVSFLGSFGSAINQEALPSPRLSSNLSPKSVSIVNHQNIQASKSYPRVPRIFRLTN